MLRTRPALRRSRALAPVVLLVAGLALSACGSDDEPDAAAPTVSATTAAPGTSSEPATPTPATTPDDAQVIAFTFASGSVTPQEPLIEVALGSRVRLTITSDVTDELHVHGYDKKVQVPAGQAVELEFVADQAGRWEVELHDARKKLTVLQVQ